MRPGAALSFEFECDAKLVGSAGLEPATFLLCKEWPHGNSTIYTDGDQLPRIALKCASDKAFEQSDRTLPHSVGFGGGHKKWAQKFEVIFIVSEPLCHFREEFRGFERCMHWSSHRQSFPLLISLCTRTMPVWPGDETATSLHRTRWSDLERLMAWRMSTTGDSGISTGCSSTRPRVRR